MKGRSAGRLDDFPNVYQTSLAESAAGTLTFSPKLEFGYSLGDNIGLVLHRIDWIVSQASMHLLLDDSDYVKFGLATSNQLVTPTAITSAVIDFNEYARSKYGTAASGWDLVTQPLVIKDWTNLPGGGLLVAPNPLYLFVQAVSMASVFTIAVRMYFTTVTLGDKGFRELWETWNAVRI